MTLYNIFTETNGYRVAKWDEGFNVEASYLVTSSDCNCPSRVKPCKHVNLVGVAKAFGMIDKQMFYDPDTAHWIGFVPLDQIRAKPKWRRI